VSCNILTSVLAFVPTRQEFVDSMGQFMTLELSLTLLIYQKKKKKLHKTQLNYMKCNDVMIQEYTLIDSHSTLKEWRVEIISVHFHSCITFFSNHT